jgi:CubicO group peptidase (beta-lactamase class C family)
VTAVVERSALDTAIERLAAEFGAAQIPGAEVAVVRAGEVVFAGGVGVRGVADPVPVGGGTLFHHGSCGKAYTGLLAVLLAADGVVDLDLPVRRYVPELRLPDPVVAERVTIRDLLCHRSGLGRHDLAWIFNPSWTPEQVLERLEHLPLVGDLRAQWSYSNFAFALAGLALGRAAGTSWAVEMHRRVLGPLGMTRTSLTARGMETDPDHATPHVIRNGAAVPTVFRLLNGIGPAGEVISCADDSVRWLLAQFGEGAVDGDIIRKAQNPQMLVPRGASPFAEMEFTGAAFGWLDGRYRGRPLVWHNGGVDGFSTQTLLLPAERIGIVVSANVFPTNLTLAAVLDVADSLLGIEPPEDSWYARLQPSADDKAEPQRPAAVANAPAAHPPADYVGRYLNAGYGAIEVGIAGDALAVRFGEYDVPATHRHYETWDLRYDPLDADLVVTFVGAADGTVAEALVEVEPGAAPVRFRRAVDES